MAGETNTLKKDWRRLIWITACLLTVLVAWNIYHGRKSYRAYAVLNQQDVSQGSLVGYEPFKRGFLKYSKDGVSYIGEKNETYWSSSFEMKDPVIDVNGAYAVIADRTGNTLQIFDEKHGKIGECRTERSLDSASISAGGIVATLEEDSVASYIQFYNPDGTVLDITVKALLEGDGFFTALDLSDDGSQVIVGVAYLEGGVLHGKVAAYDFSEKESSGKGPMRGGVEPFAGKNLISEVRYLQNGTAFAASTRGLFFFRVGEQKVEGYSSVEAEEEIRSLCFDRSYVGIVLNDTVSKNGPYRIELYNSSGERVMHANFGEHYSASFVDKGTVFLLGSDTLTIFLKNGTKQFSGNVDFSLVRAVRRPGENRYLWLGASHIKEVKLK
ncbi:DUF5711 family protein [Stomatobaculum sp. F0698]|jgi:hypothetical protein|uniref:DUF5711 family protein n=1 Tax=Stomatobaculum sp. F0698 TaxID=3059030 RepID=UPI002729D3E2|nr:DUF5711 family protein [Stomatobaculum sp. F0698]WLD86595.1 DUF5711 family protein [Stomatobaculum sp. F0698]